MPFLSTLALAAALLGGAAAPDLEEHDMELPSLEAAIEAGESPDDLGAGAVRRRRSL